MMAPSKEPVAEGGKKQLHPLLEILRDIDVRLTKRFSLAATPQSPLGHLHSFCKALEISCHGVTWLAGCLACVYLANEISTQCFYFNVLLALILDIIAVAVIKASTRRKRPAINNMDMFMTFSIDKMSFPSGHSSRAVMLALIFCYRGPLWLLFNWLIICWSMSILVSRILLGRHHIGDVVCGALLGVVEYAFLNLIWCGPGVARSVLKILGLELLPGDADDYELPVVSEL